MAFEVLRDGERWGLRFAAMDGTASFPPGPTNAKWTARPLIYADTSQGEKPEANVEHRLKQLLDRWDTASGDFRTGGGDADKFHHRRGEVLKELLALYTSPPQSRDGQGDTLSNAVGVWIEEH